MARGEWGNGPESLRWFDETVYWNLSRELARAPWHFFAHDERSMWRPPGQLAYLAMFGGSVLAVRIANIVLSSATVVLVWAIVSDSSTDARPARLALLLAATSPLLVTFAPTILTEAPFGLCMAAWVWALARGIREQTRWKWWALGAGVALGIGGLFRPIPLPLALGVVVLATVRDRLLGGRWIGRATRAAALAAAATAAVCAPVMIKNASSFGRFRIANGIGSVLYIGAHPDTLGDEPAFRDRAYDTGRLCTGDTLSTRCQDAFEAEAWRIIEADPLRFLALAPRKVARLLVGTNRTHFHPATDVVSARRQFPPIELAWKCFGVAHAAFVTAFFGVALVRLRRRWISDEGFLGIAAIGFVIGLSALTFALHRYSYPIAPLMMGMASLGLWTRADSETKSALPLNAVGLLVTIAVMLALLSGVATY